MPWHYNNHPTKIIHCAHSITLVQTLRSAEAWLWCHRRKAGRMPSSKGPHKPSPHLQQAVQSFPPSRPQLEQDLLFPYFWLPVPSPDRFPWNRRTKPHVLQKYSQRERTGECSATRENWIDDMGANFTQDRIKQTRELLSLHVSLSPGLKQCSWFGSCCV